MLKKGDQAVILQPGWAETRKERIRKIEALEQETAGLSEKIGDRRRRVEALQDDLIVAEEKVREKLSDSSGEQAGEAGAYGAGEEGAGAAAADAVRAGDVSGMLRSALEAYGRCDYILANAYLDQARQVAPADGRLPRLQALVARQARAEQLYQQAAAGGSVATAREAIAAGSPPELSPPCQMAKMNDLANRLEAGQVAERATAELERSRREWDELSDSFTNSMVNLLGGVSRHQRGGTSTSSPGASPGTSGGGAPAATSGCWIETRDLFNARAPHAWCLWLRGNATFTGYTPFAVVHDRREEILATLRKDPIDATVRIPLPFAQVNMSRIEVSRDGELDMQLYRKRLRRSGMSFQPGDHCRRLFFSPKPKEGVLAMAMMRKKSPYPKAVVGIVFGGKLQASDVTRENVVRALAGILDIEGEPAPRETAFDAAALEALLEEMPPIPAASAAATGEAPAEPFEPVLTVLSAEVEPVRVRRGERFEMLLHFEVDGVPPGRALPVTEERQCDDHRGLGPRPAFDGRRSGSSGQCAVGGLPVGNYGARRRW